MTAKRKPAAGRKERAATPDEVAGMAWWNSLSRQQRAAWMRRAGSAKPADAWALYKVTREINTLVRIQEEAANAAAMLIDFLDDADAPSEDLEDDEIEASDGDEEPSLGSANVLLGRTFVDGPPGWRDEQGVVVDAGINQLNWASGGSSDLEDEHEGFEPDLAMTDAELARGKYGRLSRLGLEDDDEREIEHEGGEEEQDMWDYNGGYRHVSYDGSGGRIARRALRRLAARG